MSKKNIITLTNIDIDSIHNKYNLQVTTLSNTVTETKTRIDDIFKSSTSQTNSFLNETIANKIYDINNNIGRYCFWDRHPFTTYPIFCPIMYIPERVNKTYFSHISKHDYNIKEDVVMKSFENLNDNRFTQLRKANYVTDGCFCSFNCVQAYINDNKHNDMYDYSSLLLIKLYNILYPTQPIKSILPAPSWRTLLPYMGTIDITKFRESFNVIEYKYKGINFSPISHSFEEHLRIC